MSEGTDGAKLNLSGVQGTERKVRQQPPSTLEIPLGDDRDDALEVDQGEAGMVKDGYVKTYGADPCTIVVFQSSETQLGAIAHMGSFNNVSGGVEAIVEEMKAAGATPQDIKAYIITGYYGSLES